MRTLALRVSAPLSFVAALFGSLVIATGVRAAEAPGVRVIHGWTLHINPALLAQEPQLTERAVALLTLQLAEVVRVVPPAVVSELRKVHLYFSPEYPGVKPTAEYHPEVEWLREHGRDPAMWRAIEFTNIRIFEAEADRMPVLALHELAHAYHDRVLPEGFANREIKSAYARAKAGGSYDRVERRRGGGKPNTFERAYALSDDREFFAETTEAFFGRNDFFPFTAGELRRHDPETFALLGKLWGVSH